MIEILMKNLLQRAEDSSPEYPSIAIMDIVYHTNGTAHLIPGFLNVFKQSLGDPRARACILAILKICLLKNQGVGPLKEIYECIINYFKMLKDVDYHGLDVLFAIMLGKPDLMQSLMTEWWPYLEFAMSKTSEPDLMESIIGGCQDISSLDLPPEKLNQICLFLDQALQVTSPLHSLLSICRTRR
jgi:hypothetical protein